MREGEPGGDGRGLEGAVLLAAVAPVVDGRAILAAAGPAPAGFAFLAQEIEPDDYRRRTVTFRGELRTAKADGRAGLVLRVTSPGQARPLQPARPEPREDPVNHFDFATGTGEWTQYLERAAVIPAVYQVEVHPYFTQPAVQAADSAPGILTQAWSPDRRHHQRRS